MFWPDFTFPPINLWVMPQVQYIQEEQNMITLAEAESELTLVNIAIQDLLAGKRINEHKLATGEFSRWYKFSEVTLDSLMSYRSELRSLITSLQPAVLPTFRSNACIPLVVTRD